MSVRYHHEYINDYSVDGGATFQTDTWRIEIFDSSFVGSSSLIDVSKDAAGFTLIYKDDDDDRFTPLKESECEVSFLIETGIQEFQFNRIATTAQEDQFYLIIKKNGNLYWMGAIMQDILRFEDRFYPYKVSIKATCGLSALKKLTDPITRDGSNAPKNLMQYFVSILQVLDPEDIIGSTDDFIETSFKWVEDDMYAGAATDDPLTRIRFGRYNVIHTNPENKEGYVYRTWHEMLTQFCKIFGLRIMFSDGMWRLYQPNSVASVTIDKYTYSKSYDFTGNDPTSSPVGINSSGTRDLTPTDEYKPSAGGNYRYLPALQEVRATYAFKGYQTILNVLDFSTGVDTEIADIVDAGDTAIRLDGVLKTVTTTSSANVFLYFIRMRITIRINDGMGTDYYYDNQNNVGWTTTATFVEVTQGAFRIQQNQVVVVEPFFSIITDNIPDSGTLYIEIDADIVDQNGSTVAEPQFQDSPRVISLRTEYIYDNEDIAEEREYVVTNDVLTESSAVYDVGDLILGDGPTPMANTRLEIFNGTDWENSSQWNIDGSGTLRSISVLLAEEIMRGQETPKRLFDFNITGQMDMHNVFSYGGKTYIINSMKNYSNNRNLFVQAFEAVIYAGDFVVGDEITVDVGRERQSSTIVTGGGTANPNGGTGVGGGRTPVVGFTSTTTTGTVTTIDVPALGENLFVPGDIINLVDPATLAVEQFEVDAKAEATDTTISVVSKAVSYEFPAGSQISIGNESLINKANYRESGELAGLELTSDKVGDLSSQGLAIDLTNKTVAGEVAVFQDFAFGLSTSISTTTTLTDGSVFRADASGGAIVLTLEGASTYDSANKYEIICVQKTDATANTVTINPDAGGTINGAANIVLSSQYDKVLLVRVDGENWIAFI